MNKTLAIAAGVGFCLAAMAARAQTNPVPPVYRNHLRNFAGRTVDLTPLFQWWQRQPLRSNVMVYARADIDASTNASPEGIRPLTAWHRITGTHVGTRGGSWVVDALIYTTPTNRTRARIYLNHPPNGEEQYFYALQAQLAQIEQQITNASEAYLACLKTEQQDKEQAETYYRYRRWYNASAYSQAAVQQEKAAVTAADQQKQAETTRDQIEQQLKAIPSRDGRHVIDWFAMMLGRSKEGLPIYDLGVVTASPP